MFQRACEVCHAFGIYCAKMWPLYEPERRKYKSGWFWVWWVDYHWEFWLAVVNTAQRMSCSACGTTSVRIHPRSNRSDPRPFLMPSSNRMEEEHERRSQWRHQRDLPQLPSQSRPRPDYSIDWEQVDEITHDAPQAPPPFWLICTYWEPLELLLPY